MQSAQPPTQSWCWTIAFENLILVLYYHTANSEICWLLRAFFFHWKIYIHLCCLLYWESTFIMAQYCYVEVIKGGSWNNWVFITETWSRKWNQVTSCISDIWRNQTEIKAIFRIPQLIKTYKNITHEDTHTHKNSLKVRKQDRLPLCWIWYRYLLLAN